MPASMGYNFNTSLQSVLQMPTLHLRCFLILLILASCGNPEGSSQLKEHEAKQSKKAKLRSPEQALQEAQQWVRDLQDASKATKWRDQSQATLSDKSKGLASGSQEGLLQAAKEAVQYANNVVQDAEKAETQLGQLIENAAQCAIHCRKASPAYSLGISLTHVQKKYDRLQQKAKQLKAGTPLDWDDANYLLEHIYFLVKRGCIDNMVGSFHTVTTANEQTDRVATDTFTDKLLGKASKKIAQEPPKPIHQRSLRSTSLTWPSSTIGCTLSSPLYMPKRPHSKQ
ncbi:MAG: hypothetical protein AAFQ78_01645 [Bacteroidota bacterium]